MDFPDNVLFNINVAVVAMILRKRYGFEFQSSDGSKPSRSEEMWEISEKLHSILIQCLGTDDSILDFINWFFDGVRKTFETENQPPSRSPSRNTSSFSLQFHHQQQPILSFPDTCFQCKNYYTSSSPQDKWCNSCESYIFESKFHTWTSDNVELDRLIRQSQQEATDSSSFLKWVPFSDFTDLTQIGNGGFSEVYSAKYKKSRLDGTLKQWVTNMECQIILNYLQSHDNDCKDIEEEFSQEKWDKILLEFATKMKQIYKGRKILKCGQRDLDEQSETKEIKRTNSFTKLKSFLKRRPSKKKNKKKSLLSNLKSNEPITKVTQIPATTSPRSKFVPKTVVLKRLVNSQNLSPNFIKELKAQYLSLKKSSKVPRMYGLTKDPQSKDYYIVLQYVNDFDLHKYLAQNCATIDWWQRISILDGIVKGIYELHKADLIHHNLHTGNILVRSRRRDADKLKNITTSSVKVFISDVGLWGPAGSSSSENNNNNNNNNNSNNNSSNPNSTSGAASISGNSNRNSIAQSIPSISYSTINNNIKRKIYGVLPYIAPEVLQGKDYTKSSDIYSLGIIMWELSNNATLKRNQRHKQPFYDQPYDIDLVTEIVINEKRPKIDENSAIPDCWLDLMKKCWSSKPEDRPIIEDIMKITDAWNTERRKLNSESKTSLTFSLNQDIASNNTIIGENVVGQFLEAEKRRIERLNKGKQVERDNNKVEETRVEEKPESNTVDDDDIHPEASMKSRLIDFIVETSSSNNNDKNLEVIYESISSQGDDVRKLKVDSGYQQPPPPPKEEQENESLEVDSGYQPPQDEEQESLEQKENSIQIEKEMNSNKYVEEDKTKHVKVDDNQIGVKHNQDNPIKNGIEANSETGSKEITITKEP